MPIDIICVAGTSLEDRAITAVESAQTLPESPLPLASHVALIFTDADGDMHGIESVPPAVRDFPAGHYIGVNARHYPLICTPSQEHVIQGAAVAALGRPYGWESLVAALLYVAEGHPETFLADPHARLDCSALVATCLAAAGIDVQPGVPPDAVTPAAVEAFCVTQHQTPAPLTK